MARTFYDEMYDASGAVRPHYREFARWLADTPADKVTLATNWLAQPELGGFYQAVADGTYARHGLEVTIKPGGPLVNNRPLLAFGKIDFLIGTNLIQPFDAAKQQIPTKVVAAFLQKDPQCLLSHADGPWKTWDDLKQAPLLMGNAGRQTFFLWLHDAYGFPRANLRPYNHSLAPFLNAPRAAMQGFATAEPEHPFRQTHYLDELTEGQAETFECRLMARDGREFWVVGNAVATSRESTGRQLTYALLDIERRRQAEISIAQAQASLQRIIEAAQREDGSVSIRCVRSAACGRGVWPCAAAIARHSAIMASAMSWKGKAQPVLRAPPELPPPGPRSIT